MLYTWSRGGEMPWSEGRVDERKRMVALWEEGSTPTELASRFGVSRPTVYDVIHRWQSDGAAGLLDRSRRPHSNSRQTTAEVTAALLNLKDQHPGFGAEKLVRLLKDQKIELSGSTARDILDRNGRVHARRARTPRWSPEETPRIQVPGPGHSMSTDYKGQFRMGNGRYCYPLTIADPASRFVFAVEGLSSTNVSLAIGVFKRVFREWGLPEQIISDNGIPFCTPRALGGLTELSKLWIKLGIRHARTQPGRPQQNGRHERMHRTLGEFVDPPAANMRLQERAFKAFLHEFDCIRPHQALGQETPASVVQTYRRPFPRRIPKIEYPSSFEVRMVRTDGCVRWKGRFLFVSSVLVGEPIAMVQTDDERWNVYFGPVLLATWSERSLRFERPPQQTSDGLSRVAALPVDRALPV